MENSGREFFERVRNGYIEISKQEPERVKLLNGKDTIDNLNKQIIDSVQKILM